MEDYATASFRKTKKEDKLKRKHRVYKKGGHDRTKEKLALLRAT